MTQLPNWMPDPAIAVTGTEERAVSVTGTPEDYAALSEHVRRREEELDAREAALKAKTFDSNKREKELDAYATELKERAESLDGRDKVLEDMPELENDADLQKYLKKHERKLLATLVHLAGNAKTEKIRFECATRLMDMRRGGKMGTRKGDDGDDEPGTVVMEKGKYGV